MTSILKSLCFGALGMGLALIGSTARAQTSGPFSFTVTQRTTDFTKGFVLPKFNTALGTLTNVFLSESLNGSFSGTVTNTSATPANFKVTEDVSLDLTLTSGGSPALSSVDLVATQTYTALASGASAPFGPFVPTISNSANFTSGTIFSAFNGGPGPVGLTLSSLTGTTVIGGGGNITNNITTTAGGTISVTYTYNAPSTTTPEPGTWAMMAAGASTGLVALRRRRRNKK
jgi:hypothetical protein